MDDRGTPEEIEQLEEEDQKMLDEANQKIREQQDHPCRSQQNDMPLKEQQLRTLARRATRPKDNRSEKEKRANAGGGIVLQEVLHPLKPGRTDAPE